MGAISHTTEDTLYIYGYGVYKKAEKGAKGKKDQFGLTDRVVELDNGDLLHGHEAFLVPEEEIEELQKEYENLKIVDVKEERKERLHLNPV